MESQNPLNMSQHRFRDSLSTITKLLSYFDYNISMLEEGHNVHAVYLDFLKAFDELDHGILLKKLKATVSKIKSYSG